VAAGVPAFTGTLATRIVLRPYDPESKGVVERADGYLETSFLPGIAHPPVTLNWPVAPNDQHDRIHLHRLCLSVRRPGPVPPP
jgi:hypothetical protein